MYKYIKRLNWYGALIMFIIFGLGAMSRKQDPTLYDSLLVWLIFGIPLSLVFLFIGIKPKS